MNTTKWVIGNHNGDYKVLPVPVTETSKQYVVNTSLIDPAAVSKTNWLLGYRTRILKSEKVLHDSREAAKQWMAEKLDTEQLSAEAKARRLLEEIQEVKAL